ncbi:MAG: hypothetical protein K2K09_04855 [Lachnospiraceae bacterium]|nr:hypothetical protein [Lachnospiraceae bacterium]
MYEDIHGSNQALEDIKKEDFGNCKSSLTVCIGRTRMVIEELQMRKSVYIRF